MKKIVIIGGGTINATGRDGSPGVGAVVDGLPGSVTIEPLAGEFIEVETGPDSSGALAIIGSPFSEKYSFTGLDAYFYSAVTEAIVMEPNLPDTPATGENKSYSPMAGAMLILAGLGCITLVIKRKHKYIG